MSPTVNTATQQPNHGGSISDTHPFSSAGQHSLPGTPNAAAHNKNNKNDSLPTDAPSPPICGAKRKRHDNMTPTFCGSFVAVTNDDENEECSSTEDAGLSLLFAASLLQTSSSRRDDHKRKPKASDDDNNDNKKDPEVILIASPRQMDVCCGRGGGVNSHPGNIMYRRVVEYNKPIYRHVPKRHRMLVSQSIVQAILNHGGRFLQQREAQEEDAATSGGVTEDGVTTTPATHSSTTAAWEEISFRRAVQKTSQALRERADNEAQQTQALSGPKTRESSP